MIPMLDTMVRLGIELGCATGAAECMSFSAPLYNQLDSGKYDVCATMPLPRDRASWEAEHRTARRRANRAEYLGYWAKPLERQNWTDDILAINLSRPYRQRRPMDAGYYAPDTTPLPDYPCALHAIRYYGVFELLHADERGAYEHLVAYMQMYRSGDLALVSQVLGHADHEPNGVMHLLFRYALEQEGAIAPGVCVYNRWDSGTWGLRQLKGWIGFEETPVEWLP